MLLGDLVHPLRVALHGLLLRQEDGAVRHRLGERHRSGSGVVEGVREVPQHKREGDRAQLRPEDALGGEALGEHLPDVGVREAEEIRADVPHAPGPRLLLDREARMRKAVAVDPMEHALNRLGRAVLDDLVRVHVLRKVLLHLLLALLHGPVVPEVSPVADQEVEGLEGSVSIRLGLVHLRTRRLLHSTIHHCLAQGRLGEAHEVGEVLDLVLLDLHVDVVHLLRREHRSQAEDGRRLLLGHV
mmetsp:Transcript_61893/g.162586  ORF Transcript_61893/g.162586 Transcript_61893/m.162586 type:complete len:243 (+) Transcript_61893:914-1642(+)